MGVQDVSSVKNEKQMRNFVSKLIGDVRALETMLEDEWFEVAPIRIGAEQEMVLVDKKSYRPALIAVEVLERMKSYEWMDAELAKFNLETNLTPRIFTGSCLSDLEKETSDQQRITQEVLAEFGATTILTGIMPTLRKMDLVIDNLTPRERYYALMEAIDKQFHGNAYELRIMGIDELHVKHDSPMLEACNTSFQVHLQVAPNDFVNKYNIAQLLAGPCISLAANSPILFGRRLWHETRIALFQQALDTRVTTQHMREYPARVNFGYAWLDHSILEVYREDIARFRVLLASDIKEDSLADIKKKIVPSLKALQIHNSTVYRWNRACYGISDTGMPHLRIENRVLPAGPTVVDEVANAAFWLGATEGLFNELGDVTKKLRFEDVRDNFLKAAKFGMDTKFNWFGDSKVAARDLLQGELYELARLGLKSRGVDSADIDKYMGIVSERAKAHQTGARWQIKTFTQLKEESSTDEALTLLTATIIKNQQEGKPVHTWEIPRLNDLADYTPARMRVEEFMQTDLYTVQKEDLLTLVSEVMDWRAIRYMAVENSIGELVGLVSNRLLLRYFTKTEKLQARRKATVQDIMITQAITIDPEENILVAMRKMRDNKIGCLPVVKGNELVGMITEMDFLKITGRLMERME